jgi:hypothetical protein
MPPFVVIAPFSHLSQKLIGQVRYHPLFILYEQFKIIICYRYHCEAGAALLGRKGVFPVLIYCIHYGLGIKYLFASHNNGLYL